MTQQRYFLLNLPNPPGRNISRAFAGGFGTSGTPSEEEILIPQYLLYAASALENQDVGYDILDAQALNCSIQDILRRVTESSPDILIAWLSLPSLGHDLQILDKIKESLPDVIIVAGGTVCKVLPNEILEKSKIDILISGYYPYYNLISEFVKAFDGSIDSLDKFPGVYFKKNGKVISTPQTIIADLDHIDLNVYHKLPVKKYLSEHLDRDYNPLPCIPILTGVGCPYSCTYCPYPLGYGRNIVTKSVENIIKEIEFLYENFGITEFIFREQAFTHNKRRVLELCNEIIGRDLDIRWLVETRVDLVDKDLLAKMKEAGCFRIHYGVETGDEELLQSIGKPRMLLGKIKTTFSLTKDVGIVAHAHMMIGFPEENGGTIEKSIRLLKEIAPDSVNINIVTPYPGTRLYEDILKEGLMACDNWSMFTSFEPVIKTRHLNERELEKARKKMKMEFIKFKIKTDPKFRRFFLKKLPKKLWNRLKLTINGESFEHTS